MLKRITRSWNLLYIIALGLVLLMVSARPELQPRPGRERAPAANVALAGHILTWPASAIAAYQIVRSLVKRDPEQPSDDA